MSATFQKLATTDRTIAPASPAKRVGVGVFVLIDALGWPYLQGKRFLADLLTYRQPVRTVLGFSSGAIPTILTGVCPAETGHWNLYYYDPHRSPFRWLRGLSFLPDAVLNHRVTRKILKEMGRHLLGLGPQFECQVSPRVLPLFNFVEKRSIYEPGGISGAPSIFDRMNRQGRSYRVYTYHQGRDAQLVERAIRNLRNGAASFHFVYLSEIDAFLHAHCDDEAEIRRKLEAYDGLLRGLFDAALAADPDATLAVFSDHGMTPVRSHFDVAREVEGLGFHVPEDYVAVYDSTMARFWCFHPDVRVTIARRLETLPCGRILGEEELRRLGVFFADRRYGELIFLLDPGWMLARNDFHDRGWMPVGMHGYHPNDSYSDAVFLSNRAPAAPLNGLPDVYRVLLASADGVNDAS